MKTTTILLLLSVTLKLAILQTTPAPSDDYIEDTQHAICKIITHEVQTTANATVKRQLKGVCTARQINLKFEQLEAKLLSELRQIRALLNGGKTDVSFDYYDVASKSADFKRAVGDDIVSVNEVVTRQSEFARTEIAQLNNTVYTLKGEQVYTYYWKINNIRGLMQQRNIHVKTSNVFISGHKLYLQLHPHYADSNYLALELKSFNMVFLKKHRFTILEQFDASKDINSQILDINTLYKVPYEKLEERNYLYKDTIIIKVIFYLTS